MGLIRPRPAQAGFTLVEAVVALSILSLVMLTTVTALRTLANTQIALEGRTQKIDEIRSVSSFLRDLFESAVVGRPSGGLGLGGGTRGTTYFRATDTTVELKSTVLFGEGFGGSYFVRVAAEGEALVLRWQEVTPAGAPRNWRAASSRVLTTGLEEFSVAVQEQFGGEWAARVDSDAAPALVRLQVKSQGRYWPDLVMKVQR